MLRHDMTRYANI